MTRAEEFEEKLRGLTAEQLRQILVQMYKWKQIDQYDVNQAAKEALSGRNDN